jgi:hypothetical protein
LQTEGPKRVLKAAGLGMLSERKPGCLAPLCAGKLLSRYCGAIYSPAKPANDDENMGQNNLHELA